MFQNQKSAYKNIFKNDFKNLKSTIFPQASSYPLLNLGGNKLLDELKEHNRSVCSVEEINLIRLNVDDESDNDEYNSTNARISVDILSDKGNITELKNPYKR